MGGVQKEFFQSIVERVFDPAVGMFEYNEETRQSTINPLSLESQYVVSLRYMVIAVFCYYLKKSLELWNACC
jgi:ubiquitin-protein ligase E3 A